jgi:hypothetical protein
VFKHWDWFQSFSLVLENEMSGADSKDTVMEGYMVSITALLTDVAGFLRGPDCLDWETAAPGNVLDPDLYERLLEMIRQMDALKWTINTILKSDCCEIWADEVAELLGVCVSNIYLVHPG